jgi:GDP-4-dehydro-6-deoxy-D-mannose reductase
MMRILVTGAGGFIGAHIVARFASDPGAEVVQVLHKSPPAPMVQAVAVARADLTDAEQSFTLVRTWKPNIVVHAAGRAYASDDDIRRINEGAGRLLIESVARATPDARMIILGSSAEYGTQTDDQPLREDRPCSPHTSYGRAKLAVTEEAMERTQRGDVRAVVLRPFNVIGPGIGKDLPLGAFLDRLAHAEGKPPRVKMGPIDFVRDFVAVDDVVRAVECAAARSIAGEIVNICSGKGRTLRELLMQMTALAGAEVMIESSPGPTAASDGPIIGDPGKCRALLGFAPAANLDAALKAAWMHVMATSDKGSA